MKKWFIEYRVPGAGLKWTKSFDTYQHYDKYKEAMDAFCDIYYGNYSSLSWIEKE